MYSRCGKETGADTIREDGGRCTGIQCLIHEQFHIVAPRHTSSTRVVAGPSILLEDDGIVQRRGLSLNNRKAIIIAVIIVVVHDCWL